MKFLFISGIMIFIVACSITYKVRNTTGEITEKTTLPSGDVYVTLSGKGKRIFEFDMLFRAEPEAPIVVFPDSIHIFFNSKIVGNCEMSGNNTIMNEKKLSLKFHIEEGVFDGDTIEIWGKNAAKCKDREISLGPYVYVFKNNFRVEQY